MGSGKKYLGEQSLLETNTSGSLYCNGGICSRRAAVNENALKEEMGGEGGGGGMWETRDENS